MVCHFQLSCQTNQGAAAANVDEKCVTLHQNIKATAPPKSLSNASKVQRICQSHRSSKELHMNDYVVTSEANFIRSDDMHSGEATRPFHAKRHRHHHNNHRRFNKDMKSVLLPPFTDVSFAKRDMLFIDSEPDVVNVERLLQQYHHPDDIHWPVKKEAIMEGDLVLGGLMMVHSREDTIMCGPIMPQGGIQALEVMLYTLDRINRDGLLPNITIGAHILDDCDRDSYGLEMAVDFIKGKQNHFFLKLLTYFLYNCWCSKVGPYENIISLSVLSEITPCV